MGVHTFAILALVPRLASLAIVQVLVLTIIALTIWASFELIDKLLWFNGTISTSFLAFLLNKLHFSTYCHGGKISFKINGDKKKLMKYAYLYMDK